MEGGGKIRNWDVKYRFVIRLIDWLVCLSINQFIIILSIDWLIDWYLVWIFND